MTFHAYLEIYLNYSNPTLLSVDDPNIHWLLRDKINMAKLADRGMGGVWCQDYNIFIIIIYPFWLASCVHAAQQSGTLDAILDGTETVNRDTPNEVLANGFIKHIAMPLDFARAVSSPIDSSVPPLFTSDDIQSEFRGTLGFSIKEVRAPSSQRPTRRPKRLCLEQGLPVPPSPPTSSSAKKPRRRITANREEDATTQQISTLSQSVDSIKSAQEAILASLNAIHARFESNDA